MDANVVGNTLIFITAKKNTMPLHVIHICISMLAVSTFQTKKIEPVMQQYVHMQAEHMRKLIMNI